MKTLAGVFPVVSTTFHDDGSLDVESQIRLVHHLLEAGAHGLALFGMAGEGYALTQQEAGAAEGSAAKPVTACPWWRAPATPVCTAPSKAARKPRTWVPTR